MVAFSQHPGRSAGADGVLGAVLVAPLLANAMLG